LFYLKHGALKKNIDNKLQDYIKDGTCGKSQKECAITQINDNFYISSNRNAEKNHFAILENKNAAKAELKKLIGKGVCAPEGSENPFNDCKVVDKKELSLYGCPRKGDKKFQCQIEFYCKSGNYEGKDISKKSFFEICSSDDNKCPSISECVLNSLQASGATREVKNSSTSQGSTQ